MLRWHIQQWVGAGELHTELRIVDRVDQDRNKRKKHIIQLKQDRIEYGLRLETS